MFRLACSVVLWGGRGNEDKYHWCVWGVLAVFWPHWVCSRSQHVCFPHLHYSGSRLLYRESALSCMHFPGLSHSGSGFRVFHKGPDSVGPAFCAFPVRVAQATRSFTNALSPGAVFIFPSTVPASVTGHASQVCLVSLLGSCFWLRTSQLMSTIQNLRKSLVGNWKPVCSLVGDAVSGAEFAPFPSPLPPASSGEWACPQSASSSLVFTQPFVLGMGG